jgi:hypothetical protein
MKVGLKLCYRLAMKPDNVVNVQDATNDDLVFSIEDNTCRLALIGHAINPGLISLHSMNFRMAITR